MDAITTQQSRITEFLRLIRISNSPTLISQVLTVFALSSAAGSQHSLLQLVSLLLASLCFYFFGYSTNDLFDYEWDTQRNLSRPLVVGTITKIEAFVLSILLLGIAFLLYSVSLQAPSLRALSLISTLVFLILSYNFLHKKSAWFKFLMAGTRAVLVLSIAEALAPGLHTPAQLYAGIIFLYTLFVCLQGRWSWSRPHFSIWISGFAIVDTLLLIAFGFYWVALATSSLAGLTFGLQKWQSGD